MRKFIVIVLMFLWLFICIYINFEYFRGLSGELFLFLLLLIMGEGILYSLLINNKHDKKSNNSGGNT